MIRIASYGAGVDSTAMILHLLDFGETIDYIVFADTGSEYPETYSYAARFDKWLRENHSLGITCVQSAKGPMHEFMLAHGSVPSLRFPAKHVEEWKIRPIEKFANSVRAKGEVEMCMGIDFSERDRQRTPRRKWIRNRYPLIEAQMDRYDCKEIIRKHDLPIPIKSGCWICPYQTRSRWLWSKEKHPKLFEKAKQLEQNFHLYPNVHLFYGGLLAKLGEKDESQMTLEIPEPSCATLEMCGR